MSAVVKTAKPIRPAFPKAASIDDLRALAKGRLPRMVFDYIEGGSGDEATARRNRSAFDHYFLQQEVLVDLSIRDTVTTVLGSRIAKPIVIAPTGMNGAYWLNGDLCLARAAARLDIPFVMSTASTVRLQSLCEVAGPLRWFQLYMLRDRGLGAARPSPRSSISRSGIDGRYGRDWTSSPGHPKRFHAAVQMGPVQAV
jgi:(S)-mandelate dehydrogenase